MRLPVIADRLMVERFLGASAPPTEKTPPPETPEAETEFPLTTHFSISTISA
jgi:hypothetical protein